MIPHLLLARKRLRAGVREGIVSRLPARAAAIVDLFRRASVNPWGGPFNGQLRRQEIVRELLGEASFSTIVETGTYRGSTTEFLHRCSGVSVHTVEIEPRLYHYARLRFRKQRGIRVSLGDSREFLRRIGVDPRFPKRRVFFYLDAHWGPEHPLTEELHTIQKHWVDWAVMIDDFKVPDDPGYGFDSLIGGEKLSVEILPKDILSSCGVFWPAAPSTQETGERRGFVLLVAKGRLADQVAGSRTLRPA